MPPDTTSRANDRALISCFVRSVCQPRRKIDVVSTQTQRADVNRRRVTAV